MSDIFSPVIQGGAAIILVLVLVGLFVLIKLITPSIKDFLLGLVADLKANTAALGALREAIFVEVKGLNARIDLAEERIKAHSSTLAGGIHAEVRAEATKASAATGQHAAQTAQDAAAIVLGSRLSVPDVEEVRRPSPPNARRPFRSQPMLPQLPPAPQATARQSVVLIVDDDEPSAKALKMMLRAELNITAAVAHSAAEVRALLRPPAALPRVAIIDLHLGTNDEGVDEYGDDLANGLPRSIAIIMVSGAVDHAGLERMSKGHAVAWFSKPIDFDALLAKVKEILAA